jgi:hypothetical protein
MQDYLWVEAGHFALDLQPQEIIRLTEAFMKGQGFQQPN